MIASSDVRTSWFDYTTSKPLDAKCIFAPPADPVDDPPAPRAVDRAYFERLMKERQYSLRQLARRMGMSHSQLSLTFSGARRLQLDEAALLSQIFGEPLASIAEHAGVAVRPSGARRVALVGVVGGDGTVALSGDLSERVPAPDEAPGECIAIQFRTAASALDWMDGCTSFCRPAASVLPEAIGRLSLAKIAGGPAVVAAVKRGYREGSYNLSGLHQAHNVHLEWATPILLSRH